MKLKENNFLLLLFISLPINLTLSGVILLAYLLMNLPLVRTKKSQSLFEQVYYPIYIFITLSLFQGLFVIDPIIHYAGLLSHYIVYLLFFFYLKKTLDSHKKVEQLVKYIVLSGFLLSIISFLSFYGVFKSFQLFKYSIYGSEEYLLNFQLLPYDQSNRKASGFNMNSNIMACYLILTFYITLISKKTKLFNNNLFYFMLFFQFMGIFLTKSRGGILSLFIGLILVGWINNKKIKKHYYFLLPFLIVFFEPYKTLIISILDLKFHSNQLRITTWVQAINIIKDFPNGVGILHYEKIYPAYKQYFDQYIPHAHNWFLHTSIESGIGLALMIFSTYIYMIFYFVKNLESEYKIIPIALISFFMFNLTDYVLTDTRVCIILVSTIFLGDFLFIHKQT